MQGKHWIHSTKIQRERGRRYFAVRRVIEEFVMTLVLERITEKELQTIKENVRQAEKWLAAKDIHNVIQCQN